jgi:hypothetical protein
MTPTAKRRARALAILAVLMLAACAAQPMVQPSAQAPGFFFGLWHGFIAWFAMIGHLFNHHIRVYAFPNAGGWYDFGFLIGISIGAGGGGAAARG